jgi:uncharacterized protein with HEPN domain
MSKRHWRLLVEDILECIGRIEQYVAGLQLDAFKASQITVDATVRNLEVIGEASRNIPEDVKEAHPELEWAKIVGLRNRVIHEYFGVDLDIIWRIVNDELPALKAKMRELLAS